MFRKWCHQLQISHFITSVYCTWFILMLAFFSVIYFYLLDIYAAHNRQLSIGLTINICDRFEQKQADRCILTNPLNATPLLPGSTFIDGFSKLIPQRIAVEISYLLVYCPWKSINKCGAGTQWRNVSWIRQGTPKRLLLLGAVTFIDGFSWAPKDFNSYPLRYQFWKSVYKCRAGTQWRSV